MQTMRKLVIVSEFLVSKYHLDKDAEILYIPCPKYSTSTRKKVIIIDSIIDVMYCSDSKPPTPRKRRISNYIFHFILVILVVVGA